MACVPPCAASCDSRLHMQPTHPQCWSHTHTDSWSSEPTPPPPARCAKQSLPGAGVLKVSARVRACVIRSVYTLEGLVWLRDIGEPGSGSTVGAPPQLQLSNPASSVRCPWANHTLLVSDTNNYRVVEVDVVTGLLVKVRRGTA